MSTQQNRDKSMLHPNLRAALIKLEQKMANSGHPVFMTEGWRDPNSARQKFLYSLGRNPDGSFIDPVHRTGVVTYAKPGQSKHEQGLAADYAFVVEKGGDIYSNSHPWELFGVTAESLGLKWGGRFAKPKTDRPHVELKQEDV